MANAERQFVAWLLVFCLGFSAQSRACSSFQVQDKKQPLFGKSYDWGQSHGLVMTNARGLNKIALVTAPGENPAKWTTSYGSLTFNQHGKEFPLGGINEAGLMIEVLWLDATQYPDPDKRPSLNELQWVQYQLDNFSSVADMVRNAEKVRVRSIYARVHYLACDKQRECATFEYLNKKLVIHSDALMSKQALCNDTYEESVAQYRRIISKSPDAPPLRGPASGSRFARLILDLDVPLHRNPWDHAFALLKSVQSANTVWQIVYDPTTLQVRFQVPGGKTKEIDFSKVDLSCGGNEKGSLVDFHLAEEGDITSKLETYTARANGENVQSGAAVLRGQIPEVLRLKTIEALAKYPDSVSCL